MTKWSINITRDDVQTSTLFLRRVCIASEIDVLKFSYAYGVYNYPRETQTLVSSFCDDFLSSTYIRRSKTFDWKIYNVYCMLYTEPGHVLCPIRFRILGYFSCDANNNHYLDWHAYPKYFKAGHLQ